MEPQPARKAQKIVVVEDNPELAEIYKMRLEAMGYTTFVANDGIAALYIVQKEMPALVLLDLMIPAIAGDQVLLRMRTSEWGKNIPVVIISNLNEADAPAGLRDLGISGYAVKANLSYDQFDQMVAALVSSPQRPGEPNTIVAQPRLAPDAPPPQPPAGASATTIQPHTPPVPPPPPVQPGPPPPPVGGTPATP